MTAKAFQRVLAVEYLDEITLVFSFFICGERFSGCGKGCEDLLFFIGGCDGKNDEVIAFALNAGNVHVSAFFKSLFINGVGSAVGALDLVSGSDEIRRPLRHLHGCIERDRDNGVSFTEEVNLLLVIEAVRLGVKSHDVVRADVTGGDCRSGHGFIGMELGADVEIGVHGVPAAGIPGGDESADDGGFGVVCAAADAVVRIQIHNIVLSFRKSCVKYP